MCVVLVWTKNRHFPSQLLEFNPEDPQYCERKMSIFYEGVRPSETGSFQRLE